MGRHGRSRSKKVVYLARKRARKEAAEKGHLTFDTEDKSEAATPKPAPTHEDNFVAFYRAQRLFPDGSKEWEEWLQTLHRALPVTFRVNAASTPAPALLDCLTSGEALLTAKATVFEGTTRVPPPKELPWCGAYQLGCSSAVLKYARSPMLQALRRWLTKYTTLGVCTRQEAVSMLPVAFLGVAPGDAVLDMCAAPGSKTTQVLEALQGHPGGFVVANDLSPKRAYMLVRRCAALGQASARLLVTQHKAQKFPLLTPAAGGSPGFDKVLADVPCCGDGTLRKSPSLWTRWHPQFASGLHTLQLQIGMRGASLLRVGGRMVYSTCSFNPVENEAVVSEMLRRCGGALRLVDTSDLHLGLARRPGLSTWTVFDDDMREFVAYADSQAAEFPAEARKRFRESMWPSTAAATQPLHLCMRFYPHLQDTGGFFVALLEKVGPLPASTTASKPRLPPPLPAIPMSATPRLSPHRYHPVPPSALASVQSLFKLRKSFSKEVAPFLHARAETEGGLGSVLTYVNEGVRDGCFTASSLRSLRHIWAGFRVLTVSRRSKCFTLTPEGAQLLLPYMKAQVVTLPARDLLAMLAADAPTAIGDLSASGQRSADAAAVGPCVLVVEAAGDAAPAVVCPGRRVASSPALVPCFRFSRGLEHLPAALAKLLTAQLQAHLDA